MSDSEVVSRRLRVVPAGTAAFEDVAHVFGTRGDPAHCWCQWYKIPGSQWHDTADDELRERLRAQLASPSPGPGLLAYDGDEPVGWCAVEPRVALPRLRRSRTVTQGTAHPDLDDPGVWVVSCFVVPRTQHQRGVGRELAHAAVGYAAAGGARVIEAYAVDTGARGRVPAADLFHGTVSMFTGAGFVEVGRPSATRVVLERLLLTD